MIFLYNGGGAGVTDILERAVADEEWSGLRTNAAKLLSLRGLKKAAELLEQYPFELHDGTNYFGDEFCVLLATVPIGVYLELEQEKMASKDEFLYIANALSEIGPFTRFVVAKLDTKSVLAPVMPPSPQETSAAVERALNDAEELIRTQGPTSALDRVHTALHGYLRIVLDRAGIPAEREASITRIYKQLRVDHPAFKKLGTRSADLSRIINTTATIVDALNVLRNQGSLAHPNEDLLEDAEAMLAINSARTLLHYLEARLTKS